MKKPSIIILAAVFAAAAAQAATTYYVSPSGSNGAGTSWGTAFTTIQAAVDVAVSNDTILVGNGTYGAISTSNKLITIQSENGAAAAFIEGTTGSRAATLGSAAGATNTVLTGFTLRNGMMNTGGGGVMGGTLNDCVLTNNTSNERGGGAFQSVLNRCTLSGNTTAKEGGGAANSTLNHCILSGNSASGNGGGALESTLNACLLTGNTTTNGSGGGAIGGTLNNCTVYGNTSAGSGGGTRGAELNNCIVWGNTLADGTADNAVGDALASSFTDAALDPLFVDAPNADFRLHRDSPCAGAGDPALVVLDTDMNGAPMLELDGSVNQGAMGRRMDIRYVAETGSDETGDGLSWATAYRQIQTAVNAAATNDTIVVSNGTYARITATNKSLTIESMNGAAVTIIDAVRAGRCATLGDTVLTGFTLQNGLISGTENGGGVSGGTLNRCVLRNNTSSGSYGGGFGGGAYYSTLNHCILTGNTAYIFGGGAYGGTLNNCTVYANHANNGGGTRSSTVNNCIIWGNTAYNSGSNADGGTQNSTFSDAALDPRFMDAPNGDFRLLADSPCIGAGDPARVVLAADITGAPMMEADGAVNQGALAGSVSNWLSVSNAVTLSSSAAGAGQTLTVDTGGAWSAATAAAWITLTTSNGSGTGAVVFAVAENPADTARTGTIVVTADGLTATATVTQAANTLTLGTVVQVACTAGNGSLSVTTPNTWSATTTADWITLTTSAGTGSGAVVFSVAENPDGVARTGTVVVTSGSLTATGTVRQAANTLTLGTIAQLASTAGNGSFSVTTPLAWSATTTAEWITLTTSGGNGNGTIRFDVTANAGAVRTGTIVVTSGGLTATATVTQTSVPVTINSSAWLPCTSLSNLSLSVTTPNTWTAETAADWIELTTPAGTGNGAIVFALAENPAGTARTGTVVVTAGDGSSATGTIWQYANTLEVGTVAQLAGTAAVHINFSVTTPLAWSAATEADWITLTDTGTSFGRFDVAKNTGEARTGAIVVTSGSLMATVTVTQAAHVLTVGSVFVGSAQSSGRSVWVDAVQAWTAETAAEWITLTTSSGNGEGDIVFDVAENPGEMRTAEIIVTSGGITATGTVTQSGGWFVSPAGDNSAGTSWETAFHEIQTAVNAAEDGDRIWVGDGTYAIINTANRPLTIRSVNGAAVTIIDSQGGHRCATLGVEESETNTVLTGFTLRNSRASTGGGASGGTLNHCVLTGNSADAGGGAFAGTLNFCILYGNSAVYGGGASYATLNNCTVYGNIAAYTGGGADSSMLNNCIVWGNTATDGANTLWCNEISTFSDAAGDPLFVDAANGDFRLQQGSPCIGVGNTNLIVLDTDMAGNPMVEANGTVNQGAYAGFVPGYIYTTTTPVPIPYDWFEANHLVTNGAPAEAYEAAGLDDKDGDGHAAWEEYIAGTNPNDEEDVLRVYLDAVYPTPVITYGPTNADRIYTLEGVDHLTNTFAWTNNLPAAPATHFYRATVTWTNMP